MYLVMSVVPKMLDHEGVVQLPRFKSQAEFFGDLTKGGLHRNLIVLNSATRSHPGLLVRRSDEKHPLAPPQHHQRSLVTRVRKAPNDPSSGKTVAVDHPVYPVWDFHGLSPVF